VLLLSLSQPILVAKIIDAHKMDQALIFVRTRVDCDSLEAYFNDLGGKEKGKKCIPPSINNPRVACWVS
jgi:superfamily II DNA/RNA helicase